MTSEQDLCHARVAAAAAAGASAASQLSPGSAFSPLPLLLSGFYGNGDTV